MTVTELQERMTPEEMYLWVGYYEWSANQQKDARQKMERMGRRRR